MWYVCTGITIWLLFFCSSQCSGILFVKINWYELAFWWWMHGECFNNIGMHIIRNSISPGLSTIYYLWFHWTEKPPCVISTTARWLALDGFEARGARSAHARCSCWWCSWEAEASSLLGLVQQQGSVQPSSSIDGWSNAIPTSCLVRLRSCRIL